MRRNSEDLKDWCDRANSLYSQLSNPATKAGNPPEFRFRSGAIIRTGHLNDEDAYTKYQGHEYQRLLIEELTQIATERQYERILSSCRSTIDGLEPHVFLTTNPGGIGHAWVKSRFIDIVEWGKTHWTSAQLPNGKTVWRSRVFIHATIDDNPMLLEKDPGYVATLEGLKTTDPDTYRAWRFGDWDIFAGQVFKEFNRAKHVTKSVIPRREFTHSLWIDWGYSENSAFAGLLSATVKMQNNNTKQAFNRVITYKEFYGNQKNPKVWAEEIYQFCIQNNIKISQCVSDPAMHSTQQSGDMDIAKMFEDEWRALSGKQWLKVEKGSNSGRNSRVGRVGMMHEWLSMAPDGIPYWVMTENCINLIRTLPALIYDETVIEAYDTDQEDHAIDASCYGLEKIKFISVKSGVTNLGGQFRPLRRYNKEGEYLDLKAFETVPTKSKGFA